MKKNILLIGVGGTGSNAVDTFFKKYHELGNQTDNKVSALVFDTDAGDLKKITSAKTVVMADSASVGTICDRIGKQYLREWFPCDAKDVRAQEMVRGASQWRKKSYLAFLNLMNKPAARSTFTSALEEMVQDPGASCEVYVIASVAGGTGSGSFIPIALYAKRYLRKNLGKDPIVNAMIALPDIYAGSQTPENRIKVYSNAYAILRELNAINLVARNYNSGLAAKKKAPINFKIGHPDEPNVGVLFDAADKRFWTPEAAPFSQVFLLDKIPGINSIQAHDMVLANSLYTILCTEIGSAFDSEFSNHELVRSQNNGSNSIYAGISTSQVRFPSESVLEYLAFKKTLDNCNSEWLSLHTAVENTIHEKEREAKAARRRFTLKDDQYAEIVLGKMNSMLNENNDEIEAIVDRCITIYDADNKPTDINAADQYIKTIDAYILSRMPKGEEFSKSVKTAFAKAKANKKSTPVDFVALARKAVVSQLFTFYKNCFNTVKEIPGSTADSVITLNKKKIGTIGDRYSLVNHLLKKDKEFIHPVAALIRLCQLRVAISKKIRVRVPEWEELNKRSITSLPGRYMEIQERVNAPGSAYLSLGSGRLSTIYENQNAYLSKKTKVPADMKVLEQDALSLIEQISGDTLSLVTDKIYSQIAADVDLLIAKYRAFFNRFEKEKESLVEQVADAHRKDDGAIDSTINVYSSKKDKDAIKELLDDGNGPETDADVRKNDNIVGEGVYNAVFAAAVAEFSADENFNNNDSSAYRSLFSKMVDSYRESIAKSEMYRNIASYNAIEAIIASCGGFEAGNFDADLRSALSVSQELAIPSLRLENNIEEADLITPSTIIVFMLSLNTAKYLKKNASKLGLRLPADQNSEGAVLKSCAEQFIRDYSGNSAARVSIVDSIPDQIVYCTGEIMDITPLCIAKFNELGEDNIYFKNYREALNRFKKYETDMWNPHLGNDLYKRGFLPYMNPEMENTCDEKMVKALLYALSKGFIRYADGVGATMNGKYNFVCGQNKIIYNNQPINNKNLAQLLNWMRNEDQKIDDWSRAFDADINEQMMLLPSIVSDNEIRSLEGDLTKTRFTKMLNDLLYVDNPKTAKSGDTKQGPSAAEFAYRIKNSEEIDRDCDDAERIMRVLNETFVKLISYRTSPENTPERFIQVYHQQLVNFYRSLVNVDLVAKAGRGCESYYAQMVDWMNQAGLFLDVSINTPLDENGNIAINKRFNFREDSEIMSVLNSIKKAKTPFASDDDDASEVTIVPSTDESAE